MSSFLKQFKIDSINFLDIGCSGNLGEEWIELAEYMNYYGFDPNKEECKRIEKLENPYKSIKLFPYAVAGESGKKDLIKTKSIYCYSLLKPNHDWLKRFHYYDLFTETGSEKIECITLDEVSEKENIKVDVIKMDTQGLELPIMKAGNSIIDKAICIESETGFLDNYINETTFSQVDQFLRPKGFLMLDMRIRKVGRKNIFQDMGKHQPMWCEVVWLYDYVGNKKKCSKEEAIKAIEICRVLKLYDYGFELAEYFFENNIIDKNIFDYLKKKNNWIKNCLFSLILRVVPTRVKIKAKKILKNILNLL